MRILLVEDTADVAEAIVSHLARIGHTVEWESHGGHAARRLGEAFDLLILDVMLPQTDGFALLEQLRARGQHTPVLMLTACGEIEERVRALDLGADDYLVKPFDIDELEARLRAMLRRAGGQAAPVIRHGELEVDPAARTVRRDGKLVEMSPREFSVLWVLLQARGRVLSRQQIEEHLYSWGTAVESNAVEVHIHHLRKKLGNASIVTMRGVGYFLPAENP